MITLNDFWRQLNTLDISLADVQNNYEINLMTKEVRNSETGATLHWVDNCTTSIGRRVELLKKNNKVSSFCRTKIDKVCKLALLLNK